MSCATAKAYATPLLTAIMLGQPAVANPPFTPGQAASAALGLDDYYRSPTDGCFLDVNPLGPRMLSPFEDPVQRTRAINGLLQYIKALRDSSGVFGAPVLFSTSTLFGSDLNRLAFAITHEPDPSVLVAWLAVAGQLPLVAKTTPPILALADGNGMGNRGDVRAAALLAASAGLSRASGVVAIAWARKAASDSLVQSRDPQVRQMADRLMSAVLLAETSTAELPTIPSGPPKNAADADPQHPPSSIPWSAIGVSVLAGGVLWGAWHFRSRHFR